MHVKTSGVKFPIFNIVRERDVPFESVSAKLNWRFKTNKIEARQYLSRK